MGVIKAVKEITGLGLKEAKELVDNARKPSKRLFPKLTLKKCRRSWKKLAQKSNSNKFAFRLTYKKASCIARRFFIFYVYPKIEAIAQMPESDLKG